MRVLSPAVRKIIGVSSLLVATIIWGLAFSAQRMGMRYLEPAFFNSVRNFIGSFSLLPLVVVMRRCRRKEWVPSAAADSWRTLVRGGLLCGLFLATASLLQQAGTKYVSAGKSGFLTALYILFVPLLGLFFHKKATLLLWMAVFLGLFGTYLLCPSWNSGSSTDAPIGIWLLLGCAVAYSGHILVIDSFVQKTDSVQLSCLQFFVVGILSLLVACLRGEPMGLSLLWNARYPLFFCGVFSSGVAFTLQIVGQKYLAATPASLVMSMESVFGALGGWLFLKEHLSGSEMLGCGIVFIATLLAQLQPKTQADE